MLADISGAKEGILKAKIDELETNSKIKKYWVLYRDNNDVKKGYQPRTNIVKDEKVIWLQIPTVFCLGGGIIFPKY